MSFGREIRVLSVALTRTMRCASLAWLRLAAIAAKEGGAIDGGYLIA